MSDVNFFSTKRRIKNERKKRPCTYLMESYRAGGLARKFHTLVRREIRTIQSKSTRVRNINYDNDIPRVYGAHTYTTPGFNQ